MRKKILSVTLFGVLLAASTGTFTSCKDYDDDIDGLNSRVDELQKGLEDLKNQFGSLAYVKSVSLSGNSLIVTDQDGKQTTFELPKQEFTDTNTTYELAVSKDGETVTIKLTGSDGSEQTFTFEDANTDTDTTLDPTLFWMDADGTMWYGPKDDKEKSTKTGVTVPQHEKTSVTVVKYTENGAVLGWEIKVDNTSTRLLIQDVLPITGFSWIPEVYYQGIEAVEFPTYQYNVVGKKDPAAADTTYVGGASTFSSFPGTAKFHINPSSATLAQVKGGAEGATVLYKGATNYTSRSAKIDPSATLNVEKGLLTATITADMNEAETAADKLDMLALQLTTTAGNTFTTSYFAAYNKKEAVEFSLVDVCGLKEGVAIKDEDRFATQWSVVKSQQATIDTDNLPVAGNAHLVVPIDYKKAVAGVDMNDYVKVALKKDTKESIIDLAENKLSIAYYPCSYVLDKTDQMEYVKMTGSTLVARNYAEGASEAIIGKTPILKVVVTDTNNGNAVVATAYVKVLYVGETLEVSDDFTATVSKELSIKWTCFADPALDYTTTPEYMSTEVYPKVGSKLGLAGLSKEQFAEAYTLVLNYAGADYLPKDAANNLVTISAVQVGDVNENNWMIKFNVDDAAVGNKTGNATYKFYAAYEKNAGLDSKYAQYPEHVLVPYYVTVTDYPTTETIGKPAHIGQAWVGDHVTCKGAKQTAVGMGLYLDMAEAMDLAKFNKGEYELAIDEEWLKTNIGVAVTGNEWYAGGNPDWIVLKKQLKDTETITVPVNVYAVLCNNDKVFSEKVYVDFVNPAVISLAPEYFDLKDALVSTKTPDIKDYIVIKSSKTGEVLYEKSALTESGKVVLGNNPSITLKKGDVNPTQWADKFTWDANEFTVSWLLDGQNTLQKGQVATCEVDIVVEFGKVTPSHVDEGTSLSTPALGGSQLNATFKVNALNAEDYDAKYPNK